MQACALCIERGSRVCMLKLCVEKVAKARGMYAMQYTEECTNALETPRIAYTVFWP